MTTFKTGLRYLNERRLLRSQREVLWLPHWRSVNGTAIHLAARDPGRGPLPRPIRPNQPAGQLSPDQCLPNPARACQSWAAVRCVWVPPHNRPERPGACFPCLALPLGNPPPKGPTDTNPGPPNFGENPLQTSQTFWDRTDPGVGEEEWPPRSSAPHPQPPSRSQATLRCLGTPGPGESALSLPARTMICPPNARFSLTWWVSESGLNRPPSAPHDAWGVGEPHVWHKVSDATIITHNRGTNRGASSEATL